MKTTCTYVSISEEDRILTFRMDPESGRLTHLGEVAIPGGPSALAVDPESRCLYASLRSSPQIATFRIDPTSGDLSLLGKISLDADACYMATDLRGRFLLSAYYGAGQVTVHPIGEDGTVVDRPVTSLSTAGHAHCILLDRSNRFVFVPHTLPANAIHQFRFDQSSGALTPGAVPKVTPEKPSGPRHILFHPEKPVVYTSDEDGSTASAYRFDPDAGSLAAFQTLSTLPEGYRGENNCAQIHIAPSGRFLYVSNRGHDSIACFSIDDATGALTAIGHQPTEEKPRAFNVDPTGNFLFAAGLETGRLAAYRIAPGSGRLSPLETYAVGEGPMWVHFLSLRD